MVPERKEGKKQEVSAGALGWWFVTRGAGEGAGGSLQTCQLQEERDGGGLSPCQPLGASPPERSHPRVLRLTPGTLRITINSFVLETEILGL